MRSLARPGTALLGWALLLLGGCAAMRSEPPPEVVPQPVETTVPEVMAEQAAVEAAEEHEAAMHFEAPPAAPAPGFQRIYRPTTRSVQDIRTQQAETAAPLDFRQRLDHAHDVTYVWMQSRVQAMDHALAADDLPLQPVPAAPFRLALVGEYIDRDGKADLGLDANFDIALQLPNLEDRLRIFVTSGELDEAPRSERETQNLSAGLRYQILRFLDFDVGVRIDRAPVLFTSLKWTREFELGSWYFYPFAKLFAETKESVGYAAAVTFDHWAGRNLLRTSTYAKWRADKKRTQWSETLVFARAHQLIVPDRYGSYPRASDIGRGWGVRLLAGGETGDKVDQYEAGIFYRRPTRTRWLYWSVEPLVRWDREFDWRADPGIRLGVEALFWDLARPAR